MSRYQTQPLFPDEPPEQDEPADGAIPTRVLDIPESISELAYLTHNFFRYYGKFPSVLGRKLIAEFALPDHIVVDNYAGSGTSLVEAKLAGYNSIGIDINPLAVLACKVKCRNYDVDELAQRWQQLQERLEEHHALLHATEGFVAPQSRYTYNESVQLAKSVVSESSGLDKWFGEKAIYDLAVLKHCLLQLPVDAYRDFFTLAFFAIIRRTSVAYDGEIRPHVNKDKRSRPVLRAFIKKVSEMIAREHEWIAQVDANIWSDALIADNRRIAELPIMQQHPIGLAIAHPPYLNSFDYLPVFSLEFRWADGFADVWQGHDLKSIRKMESRAWPATNAAVLQSYFADLRSMLAGCFEVLVQGGACCVVIGDATIRKELVPVLNRTCELGQDAGFRLEQIIYRTTHYGVGKYAYNFRADYHGNGDGKKDGVLIFRKD